MSSAFTANREQFACIGCIPYQGPASDNPFAFEVCDADWCISGQAMSGH